MVSYQIGRNRSIKYIKSTNPHQLHTFWKTWKTKSLKEDSIKKNYKKHHKKCFESRKFWGRKISMELNTVSWNGLAIAINSTNGYLFQKLNWFKGLYNIYYTHTGWDFQSSMKQTKSVWQPSDTRKIIIRINFSLVRIVVWLFF